MPRYALTQFTEWGSQDLKVPTNQVFFGEVISYLDWCKREADRMGGQVATKVVFDARYRRTIKTCAVFIRAKEETE